MNNWKPGFDISGFVVIPDAVPKSTTISLTRCIEHALDAHSPHALRNILAAIPEVDNLARSPILISIVEAVLGPGAFPVRGLFFDKTPEANWKVAWHQDVSIAVQGRAEVPGFGPWSVKENVPHVQPPASILEQMLTVRLHLDDCTTENGPLQVLPGTHRFGKLNAAQIQEQRSSLKPEICTVQSGGVVLMRPLLLHASSPAGVPNHRRVIHLEYAASPLPDPLRWQAEQID